MANNNDVEVQVTSLRTNRKAKFKMPNSQTLQQVWDAAYGNFQPAEQKAGDDKFQCEKGTDLSAYLNLTLEAAHQQHICQNRHFEIIGGTGGA